MEVMLSWGERTAVPPYHEATQCSFSMNGAGLSQCSLCNLLCRMKGHSLTRYCIISGPEQKETGNESRKPVAEQDANLFKLR